MIVIPEQETGGYVEVCSQKGQRDREDTVEE